MWERNEMDAVMDKVDVRKVLGVGVGVVCYEGKLKKVFGFLSQLVLFRVGRKINVSTF